MLLNYCAKEDPYIRDFYTNMQELKSDFDHITITYTYEKPTYEIKNGILTVVDHSSTKIDITQEDVKNITESVNKLREYMIL